MRKAKVPVVILVRVSTVKQETDRQISELRAYAKAQVAAYKYPRHLQIIAALPKGPTGKILKREITLDVQT